MRHLHRTTSLSIRIIAIVLVGLLIGFAPFAGAQKADGTIELEIVKAGLIIGGSGGSGTLHYKGKDYPVTIGGVSFGATIGVSKAQLTGEVFNLKSAEDIQGVYAAGGAGYAMVGGEKHIDLKNDKGVLLMLRGTQKGAEFSLDLNGLKISFKE